MKWPSSSASAARNSAKISSSVTLVSLDFSARNRPATVPRPPPLEGLECPAYKAAKFGPAVHRRAFLGNRINRGDDETIGMGDCPGGNGANTGSRKRPGNDGDQLGSGSNHRRPGRCNP